MSSDFSVVAIIAAYNEADIIEQVVIDLVQQGFHVYFLDDGSTDDTVAIVERHLGRGVLGIEPVAEPDQDASRGRFDWERILRRKAQLATDLDASWFIHHDADEFRESPWSHLPLIDAIRHVDGLGFNAIDFMGLDFWPVHDRFRPGDDVREAFTFYSELAPYDRVQVRCWKKTGGVDLTSSGGHEARFPGRRVFPIRFILRHYPIRGQAHGERKVFQERRNRFRDQERTKGWHVQYDQMVDGASFVRDSSTLTRYDADALRLALTLRPRYPQELEGALAAAGTDLAAAQLEVASARSEIEAMRRELEAASTHIDHVTSLVAVAREDVRTSNVEAAALRNCLEQRTAELVETQAEIDARGAYIATLLEAARERAAESERWRAAVEGLTRRLDEYQRSLSWRWTAPGRVVYRMFTGS